MTELEKFLDHYKGIVSKMSSGMFKMLDQGDGLMTPELLKALVDFTTDEVMKVVPEVVKATFEDEDLIAMNKVQVELKDKVELFQKITTEKFDEIGNDPSFNAKLEAIVKSHLSEEDTPSVTH